MALTDTNNIQDPSTIGVGGLSGTRADETGSEIVKGKYSDFASNLTSLAADSRFRVTNNQQYNPIIQSTHTIDRDEVGGQLADFGNSKYDDPFTFQYSDEGIQDNRYEKQWGITKLGLGVAKGAITAGTTFIDGTVGFLNGLGQGVANVFDDKDETGFLDGLWNNDTHRAMKDVSDKMENTFKIYQSTKNQEGPWYAGGNLISGAFIGDTIIKNIGFMVGAFYSGSFLTKLALVPKALQAMKASNNVVRSAQMFTGSLTSAVGEASIEAINNVSQWADSEKEKLKVEHQRNLAELERTKNILTSEEYQARLDNLNAVYQEGLQKIDRDAIHMGNMDFALQIPILTAENAFGWGKLYASNFASSKFMNSIRKTAEGYRGNNLKGAIEGLTNSIDKPTVEGVKRTVARMAGEGPFEEMGQSFVNELSGEVAENDVMSYYKARVNGEAYDDVFASWKSQIANLAQQAPEAFGKTYLDADSWEEGFVGAISSVFGMPKFRSARTAEGKWQSPITFEGGIVQDIKDAHKESGESQQVIDYLKSRLDDPAFLESFEHATAHQAWDYVMQGAARDGNQKKFNDAKVNQMVNDLYALQKAGLLDVAKTLIETGSDININTEAGQRDLDYVKANDKSEVEVPNDPLDPSKGTHKEIVSARGWFDKDGNQIKTDEEIVKDIKSRKDEILKYVKQFEKVTNELDNDTAGIFSDDQLKELSWLQMRVFDDYDRVGSILHDIQRKNTYNLQDILDNQKANGKLSEEKYNELTEKLNSTLDNLDFKDLTAEKWHKLIKKNPELIDILNYFGGLSESNFKSKDLYQQFQDIFGLQKDIKQFEKTFNEFKENPGLLKEQINKVRNDARKKKVEETAKKWEESLSRAKDLDEFEEMYSASELLFESFNEEEGDKYREWFNDYLNKSTNKQVSDYLSKMRNKNRYVNNYNNATSKIKNNDFSEFSEDEQGLLEVIDSDVMKQVNAQLEEIFSPLLEGMSFDRTRDEISNKLKDIINSPNTVLSKETEVIAKHILDKLDEFEKINKSKQQEERKKDEEPNVKKETTSKSSKDIDLLNDETDWLPAGEEQKFEQKPEQQTQSLESSKPVRRPVSRYGTDPDNLKLENQLEELSKELVSIRNKITSALAKGDPNEALKIYNDELIPKFNEFKDLIEKNKIVDYKPQPIDNFENVLMWLKDSIDRSLKDAEESRKSQESGLTSNEKPTVNDLLDKINSLSLNELIEVLNGKPTTEAGVLVTNMIDLICLSDDGVYDENEEDRKKITDIIRNKIEELKPENAVARLDDTNNTEKDDNDNFKEDSEDGTQTQKETETIDENEGRTRPLLKNWIETLWSFSRLVKDKIKTFWETENLSVKFLHRYNSFDFVDKGLLAMIVNRYRNSNNGNEIPIHLLAGKDLIDYSLYNKNPKKYSPRRQPVLAIELDGELLSYFDEITSKHLGSVPELIEANGKKYYPVGVVGFYENSNSKTNYGIIQNLMYQEVDSDTKQRILFADTGKDWYVSKYTTQIARIFSGRLYTKTDEYPVSGLKPLSETAFKNSPNKLIFGIKNRNGAIISRQTTEEIAGLKYNINSRLGSTWILVRGGDGVLYPTATKVARFNSTEYDWQKNQDKPIVQKMLELARVICDESQPFLDRCQAKYNFERILGFPTDSMGRVENPIKISDFGEGEIITIKPQSGFKIASIKGETVDEKVTSFMNAMMEANYKFNISLLELGGGDLFKTTENYLQTIIKSDIVFTDLIEPSFAAAHFEIYPLDESGNISKVSIPDVKNSKDASRGFDTSIKGKLQYQLGNGVIGIFEYDDSRNVKGDLSPELKKVAADLYNIHYNHSKYVDSNGEFHGGIYHKDGDSYYIKLSGVGAYTVYTSSDSDYKKIADSYEHARKKDSPSEQKFEELKDNLTEIGKSGNQTDSESQTNQDETTESEEPAMDLGDFIDQQPDKPKKTEELNTDQKGIIINNYRLIKKFKYVAKMLNKDDLTDEELLALNALERSSFDVDNIQSIDELNGWLEKAEICNGIDHFRFTKPKATTTPKRKFGKGAEDFSKNILK